MICKRLTSNERPTFPKRAIITAGMPYGNKDLHFGHVGGMFIHADIFARFLRDRIGKENVIFLSGTDCYNIYFYAIAQTGLFTGLQVPKGEVPNMEKAHLSHIIANRHLLYMDTKASSSSEIKPPTADELLDYYTKDQLRMHFMSLGLSSKSVGFKPQVFMNEEERVGVDMVLKDGNLITNVFNRLIRTCFYAIQNNCDGRIPEGEVSEEIKIMAILIHPIAPEVCEMFREYLNVGEELWDWNHIFDPISFYVGDVEKHKLKYLEPRVDFFKKHDCQLAAM